jgi:transposase
VFKAKTRVAWRDLPERYGPWNTVYGALTALVARVRVIAEAIDGLDREVSVDSSVVRAHQHAAGARQAVAVQRSPGGGRVLQRTRRAR